MTERVIGQFLAEMDGVEDMNGVLVLGGHQPPRHPRSGAARPGRFDIQLEIPLPDLGGRGEIFRIALRDKPAADDISIDDLASRSEGFTGAEIQGLCTTAARSALRGALEQSGGDPESMPPISITRAHLDAALEEVKSHPPPPGLTAGCSGTGGPGGSLRPPPGSR